VSAETVRHCAVRWTPRTPGQCLAARAAGWGARGWWQSILQARDRVAIAGKAEQKFPPLLQQNPMIYIRIPNIPEV
jgi:hypothetical protein